MRITQGCFSFLPDLTDDQIRSQVQYCIDKGWAVNLEYTDDPHPRNTFWEMWDLPMFDIKDAAGVLLELNACRKAHGDRYYIRLSGFRRLAWLGKRAHSPSSSTGRRTSRASGCSAGRPGPQSRSTPTQSYAVDRPEGERYRLLIRLIGH